MLTSSYRMEGLHFIQHPCFPHFFKLRHCFMYTNWRRYFFVQHCNSISHRNSFQTSGSPSTSKLMDRKVSTAPASNSSGRNRHSRQAKSYQPKYSERILSNSSPHQLPYGVSHGVLSIISRFEQLNAGSLLVEASSLRPAALQLSRSSSRRRTGIILKKFPAIYSPNENSSDTQYNIDHEDKDLSVCGGFFGVPTRTTSVNSRRTNELQEFRPSGIILSSKVTGDFKVPTAQHPIEKAVSTTVELSRSCVEDPKRRKTVKDIIRFYDGCTIYSYFRSNDLFLIQHLYSDIRSNQHNGEAIPGTDNNSTRAFSK